MPILRVLLPRADVGGPEVGARGSDGAVDGQAAIRSCDCGTPAIPGGWTAVAEPSWMTIPACPVAASRDRLRVRDAPIDTRRKNYDDGASTRSARV